MHACTYVLAFFMLFGVRMCVHVFCALQAPLFDLPSMSWKGNMRTPNPQCRSHLCPLMIGQRLSRPNHGCLSCEMRTQSRTHEEIFPVTFYCGECTAQTSPAAFVGRCSDALLLRRWMDGCHAEVKTVLSSLRRLSSNEQLPLLYTLCLCLFNSLFLTVFSPSFTWGLAWETIVSAMVDSVLHECLQFHIFYFAYAIRTIRTLCFHFRSRLFSEVITTKNKGFSLWNSCWTHWLCTGEYWTVYWCKQNNWNKHCLVQYTFTWAIHWLYG